MKSFIVCFMIGAAAAGRLPNSYIPPSSQSSAGSQFLQTPFADQINQGPYPASGGSNSKDGQATIVRYDNQPNAGDGSYSYSYETSNGIKVDEQGYNTQQGPENSEQVVTGSYSYVGDDGRTYTVTYKADANGFQAQGDHLPTPPPIPEAIQRSLDFIARQNQQQTLADSPQNSQSYLPPNQASFDTQQGYRY